LVQGKTAIILPCLGRTEVDQQAGGEQFVSVENSIGIVHRSQGRRKPVSKFLLSEPGIVAELAKATLPVSLLSIKGDLSWDTLVADYDNIRNLIEKTIPGFEDYNSRVRRNGGFYLPNSARVNEYKTATGRAQFTINMLADHQLKPGEYLMMTIRSHDQYNTTIYAMDDRYRGVYNGRQVLFMNEGDAKQEGLKQGDEVDIISEYDGIERRARNFAVVPYSIPSQNVAAYFPEANAVVPHNHFARGSQTPISKSVVVRLERKN
jgi:anaerobic selenocysteine-containing dehydrogenase